MKKVIQRNLPITTTYTIIGSYYSSIEEAGTCCENCGKAISNVAEIQSAEGRKYLVGMDCAGTLSGIKGEFDFEFIHKSNFTTAKSERAKLLKFIKSGGIKNLEFTTFTDDKNYHKEIGSGKWEFEFLSGGANWKQFTKELWQGYVFPMIKDLKA